jgi:lysophospholipase L1-like esterase
MIDGKIRGQQKPSRMTVVNSRVRTVSDSDRIKFPSLKSAIHWRPLIQSLSLAVLTLVSGSILITAKDQRTLPDPSQRSLANTWKFDFGPGQLAPGFKRVMPQDIYSRETGFGFEPGAQISCTNRDGKDPLRTDFCTSEKPFYFSVAVPEGNYHVTVTLGDEAGESITTVKAELRRLMLERVETKRGKFDTRSFTVNVRTPQIAAGGEVKLKDREKTTEIWAWDEKLTLEFNGSRPAVCAVEVVAVDVPTIYLLGDSTVCDQPREPYNSWGQMLTRFFKPGVAVANHAESGESLRSSLGARRLDKVLSTIKAGDYLFIQYGHNDEKEKGERVGAFTTYKSDLKNFVAGARERGAIPVLITPVQRRTFDKEGKITNSHGDYPEAVRQAAREENVPLIDLNAMSKTLYEAWGDEPSKEAFAPNDNTHHDNYGSYELAKCIVEGIRSNKLAIAKFLVTDVPAFDPSHPDSLRDFKVPASPLGTEVKPLGN